MAFAIDKVIFAICIIEIIPSSKRVPELEIIETIGNFFDTAKSIANEIFSPEIKPKFPPMNEKSSIINIHLFPPIDAYPVKTESFNPERSVSF